MFRRKKGRYRIKGRMVLLTELLSLMPASINNNNNNNRIYLNLLDLAPHLLYPTLVFLQILEASVGFLALDLQVLDSCLQEVPTQVFRDQSEGELLTKLQCLCHQVRVFPFFVLLYNLEETFI